MSDDDRADIARRTVLQITAGLAAAGASTLRRAAAAVPAPAPTGRPGDFDFLSGHWKIANRQLKQGRWDEYESEATVHGLLRGIASVEELRIPARDFSGMGLRLLDVEKKLWADFWVNAKSGVLTPPPSWGSFSQGVGLWDSADEEGDPPTIVRGAWDRITPTSCRWYQALSHDAGKTWQETWIMNWRRA